MDGAIGVEQLRLSCGGHGYMDASNLPATYGLVTAICTYEGENTVLLLQTARYLVKAWKQAVSGEALPPTTKYLELLSYKVKQQPWKNTFTCIVRAHQAVAAGSVSLYVKKLTLPVFFSYICQPFIYLIQYDRASIILIKLNLHLYDTYN
jgi:acyl-CoA oxidase